MKDNQKLQILRNFLQSKVGQNKFDTTICKLITNSIQPPVGHPLLASSASANILLDASFYTLNYVKGILDTAKLLYINTRQVMVQ